MPNLCEGSTVGLTRQVETSQTPLSSQLSHKENHGFWKAGP